MPIPRVPPNRWPLAPEPPKPPKADPPLPQRRLEVIPVMVRCKSLQAEGWELEDTEFEIVPRIGEEVHVATKKQNADGVVCIHSGASLIVEQVVHFGATCNGWRLTDPRIMLECRVI